MKIENINVGDKFPTENKLKCALDIIPSKGNQGKAQIKEIKRFLNYEKTHKISRGKETNEIVITEIYSKPLEKVDRRSERSSEYIDALAPALQYLNGRFTTSMLMQAVGLISDKEAVSTYYEFNGVIRTYKNIFKSEFRKKAFSTLNYLEKTSGLNWEYCYFCQEFENQQFYKFHKATNDESKVIDEIIKDKKAEFEKEYDMPYKKFKFDQDKFGEYTDAVNDELYAKLGYCSYVTAFFIDNKNGIDYENDIDNLMDSIVDKVYSENISELFENRMSHIIDIYKYDVNKYKRQSLQNASFGQSPNMFQNENYVFPLKCQDVYSLHESIFNKEYDISQDHEKTYSIAKDDEEYEEIDDSENPF